MKAELIALDDIVLPKNRQRKENADEHIKKLAESILEHGLIHAITVDQSGTLVAGWCRYQAIKSLNQNYIYGSTKIPPGTIPVIYTHKTDEKGLALIELEENIRRKDLSPLDKAQAIAKLHEIKKHMNPQQTVKDTAADLASMRGKGKPTSEEREIADSILLSNFAADIDIQTAKTKGEAVRKARKKLETSLISTLGAIEGNADLFRKDQQVIFGNALHEMPNLPEDVFDVLLFDPPYGMGAHAFGEQSFSEGHEYDDTPEYAESLIKGIITEADRVLKKSSAIFMFCDIRFFFKFKELLEEHSWYVWSTPLIWDKGAMGHCPRPGFGPKRSYEAILYAYRGDFRTIKTGSDILRFPANIQKLHAAEKPVELLKELLSWGALAGSYILDPTCGSGSSLLAARDLNMNATGIEASEKFVNITRAKLSEHEKESTVNPLDFLMK